MIMKNQATLFRKRPFLIMLVGLLVLIFFGVVMILRTVKRSSTMIYPMDAQYLSRCEIQDMVNEYFVPTLTMYIGEKGRELTWEYDTNNIHISIVADAETIRKLRKFNKVTRLGWPAYLRGREILQRQQSSEALQQLYKILMKYQKDHDGKFPDHINQLKEYDMNDVLPQVLNNIQYGGEEEASYNFRNPLAYDKRLLQKGNGTNVLFPDGYVGFEKPDKLESLGIFQISE